MLCRALIGVDPAAFRKHYRAQRGLDLKTNICCPGLSPLPSKSVIQTAGARQGGEVADQVPGAHEIPCKIQLR